MACYFTPSPKTETDRRKLLRARLSPIIPDRSCTGSNNPWFAVIQQQKILGVAYWNMWADAGADMRTKITHPHFAPLTNLTLLECFSYQCDTPYGAGTFQELVLFFLARFPDVALNALLSGGLPQQQDGFFQMCVSGFLHATQHLLTKILLVRTLAPLVTDFLLGHDVQRKLLRCPKPCDRCILIDNNKL